MNSLENRNKAFLDRAVKQYGYKFDYSRFVYVDAKTKGIIICPKHGEFLQNPDKHLSKNGHGCTKCFREYTKGRKPNRVTKKPIVAKEHFLQKCKEKYGDTFIYNLENYNGITKNKIEVICPKHGSFLILPRNHIISHNTTGCKECGKEKAKKSRTKSYENFLTYANKIHNSQYEYPPVETSGYKNRKSKIEIYCKKHGPFIKSGQKHLSGQGCEECMIERLVKENRLVGGYSEELFTQKPFLKEKQAKIYYLKINDGKYYKIGISITNLSQRIGGIIAKAKLLGYLIKCEIIAETEMALHKAFVLEQKIIQEAQEYRVYTKWSTELFDRDISYLPSFSNIRTRIDQEINTIVGK